VGLAGLTATVAAVLAVAMLPGCAAQPARPSATTTASAQSSTTSPGGTGLTETTVTSGSNAPTTSKVPSGYRRVTRNGKELFCRKVVTLGSRFPEQMCFTREQLEEIANRTDETINNMERSKAVCTGGTQCSGT
jgi:hypothetical protein